MLTTFYKTHEIVFIGQKQANIVNFLWFNLVLLLLLKQSSMILIPHIDIMPNYSLWHSRLFTTWPSFTLPDSPGTFLSIYTTLDTPVYSPILLGPSTPCLCSCCFFHLECLFCLEEHTHPSRFQPH